MLKRLLMKLFSTRSAISSESKPALRASRDELRAQHADDEASSTSDAAKSVTSNPPVEKNARDAYQLAVRCMRERRLDESLNILDLLLASNAVSTNPWFHAECLNASGHVLHQLRRYDDAESRFETALRLRPDYLDAHYNRGLSLLERGDLEMALRCFEDALRIAPADADSLLELGILTERKGEFEKAREFFEMAARLNPRYEFARMVQIDRELLEQLEQEIRTAGAAENAGSAAPTVVWRSQRDNTSEDPKLVVIVTCDEKYFLKYGKAFIRSFAANAGNNCALHLHVLDPSQHFVLEQSSLLHELARCPVSVSFETTGGIVEEYGDDFRWRKVWYTCARFMHLPAWLRSFGRPIILVDIDAIIERPMEELLTALQNAPMGMYFRDPRAAPWMDIVANVVVAAPAPEAEEFFGMVRAFLLHHRRNGLLFWHLDQVALYCVWRMLSVYRSAPHVSAIQEAAGQVHWHLGNAYDHKLSLPRYTRYSND